MSNVSKFHDFTFVHVAGLNANKNQVMLLESFKKFQSKHPKTRLLIVGDGPMRQELEKLSQSLQLTEKVDLLGYQSRDELSETYNKCHAFVLSSHRETFGVVLIEAMSCGLPVLSTRCGGPESIITDTQLGELTDISSEEICKGMEHVYSRQSTYNAAAIRTFAINNFSGPAVAKKLSDIYQKVLKDDCEQ
jgi:glycosyltransferase involved in cell wall biosynthesis